MAAGLPALTPSIQMYLRIRPERQPGCRGKRKAIQEDRRDVQRFERRAERRDVIVGCRADEHDRAGAHQSTEATTSGCRSIIASRSSSVDSQTRPLTRSVRVPGAKRVGEVGGALDGLDRGGKDAGDLDGRRKKARDDSVGSPGDLQVLAWVGLDGTEDVNRLIASRDETDRGNAGAQGSIARVLRIARSQVECDLDGSGASFGHRDETVDHGAAPGAERVNQSVDPERAPDRPDLKRGTRRCRKRARPTGGLRRARPRALRQSTQAEPGWRAPRAPAPEAA